MSANNNINGHFDHVLAGLMHLILQCRARIAKIVQELADVDRQIASVVRDFHKLADIHSVWYQPLPGYESSTFRIESQLDKAQHYWIGTLCATIFAVVFGVYVSFATLNAESFWLLFFGSATIAIVVGVITSVVLRATLGAHPENPHAIKRVNIAVGIIGVSLLLLLAFFAWLRFKSDSPYVVLLPGVMVGLELTAIILAGAFDCGYRLYRWSRVLDERHRGLLNRKAALQDSLANEHVTQQELEYRLNEHQNKPLVADEAEKEAKDEDNK